MPSAGYAKPPDWLAAGDAARELGVAVETLRRWEREGRIAAVRTAGGHRRFHRADIERMVGEPARSAS